MGLSAAMEIGKNGLNVYRIAQEVTGENIANVNTPGYSRQRVVLETAPPNTSNGFPLGTGVQITAIDRYYDGLLQQQLVNAQSTQGYDTTKSQILQQVEPSFNEVANDGIGTAVANYFSAWQDLSLNPGWFCRASSCYDPGPDTARIISTLSARLSMILLRSKMQRLSR